ncbi:MAG: hypothetical protein IT204_17170 [Fimbriimonadaceae bacterium]|nr:hypothetical protein [Fimbriimonadaceae bacterium]
MRAAEYYQTVQRCRDHAQVLDAVRVAVAASRPAPGGAPGADPAVLLEFLIVRGFELDLGPAASSGAAGMSWLSSATSRVVWPFGVSEADAVGAGSSRAVEQIDGGVHLPPLSCLFETKSRAVESDIEPVAKLVARLMRRPAGVIGAVFSPAGFTQPCRVLSRSLAPITVLLWTSQDIETALQHPERGGLVAGLLWKYRQAVDKGVPDANLAEWQDCGPSDRLPG